MEKRLQLIRQCVNSPPLNQEVIDELKTMGWDYHDEPYKLSKVAVVSVLNRYIFGDLSEEDVYRWADFLEGRDDVDYKEFNDVIFWLANPQINGPLSPQKAEELVQSL